MWPLSNRGSDDQPFPAAPPAQPLKIELFTECPRCLYLDVARGIPRPSGPPFTLNNAVDALMKSEFDRYRAAGEPHPLFATAGIDAVPFRHADARPLAAQLHRRALERRRDRLDAVRRRGRPVAGALGRADGRRLQGDRRAPRCRRREKLYPSYRRQMDVYQFLVRRQGFEVSDRGWFVYTNGDGRAAGFGDKLGFTTALVPYDGNDAWVLDAFRRAVATIGQGEVPPAGAECKYCAYVASAAQSV